MLPQKILKLINESSFDQNLQDRIKEWGQFPSFATFVEQNENKILKKLKIAKEDEDKRDIGVELYIGFIFSKASCQVIYGPVVPIPCNPDFKISFEGNSFFCEVTRLRKVRVESGIISNEAMYKKCGDIICEKITQTVPESINVIYVRIKRYAPNLEDLKCAVTNLFKLKETNSEEFLKKIKRCDINSINEFDKYWKQLSGIIISRPESERLMPRIWENPDASNPLNSIIKLKIEEAIQAPFRYNSPFDE